MDVREKHRASEDKRVGVIPEWFFFFFWFSFVL